MALQNDMVSERLKTSKQGGDTFTEVGGTHGGELTVGPLRKLIADLPDDTPVLAEVHDDGAHGWILSVEDAELSGATIMRDRRGRSTLHLSLSRICPHGLNPYLCDECNPQ